ncbi:hypothetical protein [Streptomyces sp. NPDC001774]
MSDPYDEPEGWPCVLSEEVTDLLMDSSLPADVFAAIVALTVTINEARGEVLGSSASAKWPQQRRIPIGVDGSLGVAEYVIVAHAEPPQIVLTRVQLY